MIRMKKIFIVIFIALWGLTSQAQSSLSIYGGATMSKVIRYGIPLYVKQNPVVQDLYGFPPLYMPYFAMEYEYDYRPFRFSTGLSIMAFGTSSFFMKDHSLASMYLVLPLIAGRKWNLAHNWGITLEAGVEVGLLLKDIGGIAFIRYALKPRLRGNIGVVTGVEANWKNLRFGARFQLGLTNYEQIWIGGTVGYMDLKHSSLTAYVGYTLWDSAKAKKRKLIKEQEGIEFK